MLLVPAVAYLIWLGVQGQGSFTRFGIGYDLLLAGGGVVTAVPLLLFSFAAQRVPLSVLGLTQYLAPTLQFLFGVFWFGEPMPPARWVGFVLVWIALMLITTHALLAARANRRRRARG